MSKAVLLCLLGGLSWQSIAGEWQPWFSSDGLEIAKRKADQGINEVKVSMRIENANTNALLGVLEQVEQAGSWLPNVETVVLVSHPVPSRHLVYTVFDAPFPVTKRQLLTSSCLSKTQQGEKDVYHLAVKGIVEPSLPKDIITITPMRATWQFYDTDNTLFIDYQAFANPNGHLPVWLVNRTALTNTKLAFQSLRELLSQQRESPVEPAYQPSNCDNFN